MAKMMLRISCLCALALGLAGFAKANTIGPTCGSCLGSSYDLTYTATGNPDVFDVYLTVNTTGFTNPSTDLLNAVSLKLVPQSSGKQNDIVSVSLLSEPSTFGTTVSGGLSASGCDGSGNGFFCSGSTGKGVPVAHSGDIYTWEWQLDVKSPSDLMTGADAATVKALYVTSARKHNGITSEDITLSLTPGTPPPVPEPSTLGF